MTKQKMLMGSGVLLTLVAAAVAAVIVLRIGQPSVAPRLADETTLVVLRGEVSLEREGRQLGPVTADVAVRAGDRIRTGSDSFAAITYFDGSSTTVEPNTDIVVRRLDRLAGGGANISLFQEVGQTWNRVERLLGASSRFETVTAASVGFVRGTQYVVIVELSQRTVLEVLEGTVSVEAAGATVVVEAGYFTTIVPGQPPSPPVLKGRSTSTPAPRGSTPGATSPASGSRRPEAIPTVPSIATGAAAAAATQEPVVGSPTAAAPTDPPPPALPTATSAPATAEPTLVPATALPEPTSLPSTATPEPTSPPPSPSPTARLSSVSPATRLESEVLDLINGARQGHGLPPLAWDPDLTVAARAHTQDMRDRGFFSHDNPDGEGPGERMLRQGVPGYRPGVFWGENISDDRTVNLAHAKDLEEELFPGGHHTNIDDRRFTRIGIAVSELQGRVLITVLFLP